MRLVLVLLVVALAASLAINAWLLTRPPPEAPEAPEGRAIAVPRAHVAEDAPAFAAVARAIEESKKARTVESMRAVAGGLERGTKRADVDARIFADVQCRVAREKAAEAWRKEGEGIQKALVSYEEPNEELRASSLQSEKNALADVIGADPEDARVTEAAEKRQALKRDTSHRWQEALTGNPPDWRTGVDILLDFYRRCDAESLRILGEEKAADVRLADVDERAALLAIGASLMDAPWESVAVP